MPAEDHQPISRLPVEILCQIFDEYRKMHLRDVLPEFVYPEWVKITLVCRSWRNTVINCPNLWTYIPEYSDSTPRWIATHFERAGPSVPLHIHWDGRGRQEEHTSPLIGFIPTNLHRIQTLKLTDIGGDPGDPRLRTLSSGHAPLLQSLSISCYGLPVLPDEILSGGTPKLQKLVLRSCLVKPTASLLRNITLFELQCFPDDNENGPRIQDILKQMPQLTHLRLQLTGGAKLLESQSAQLEDAVPVPSVTNVTCEADFETCRALFEAVAFPPSAMVLVYCFLRSEQSPHLLSASGFRPQWILPHQDPDKPQTLIFRSSSYRTMLVLWCDFTRLRTGAPTVDEEPVGGVFIIFKIGHWRMKLHEASRILRAQSLGSIRCMEFVWTWNETEATCAYLIDVWERLTALEELVLTHTQSLNLFLYSYQHCSSRTLPTLKTMRLWKMEFSRREDEEHGCMEDLLQMVESRFHSGQKIEELLLGSCSGVTQEDLDRLGKYVSYVHTM